MPATRRPVSAREELGFLNRTYSSMNLRHRLDFNRKHGRKIAHDRSPAVSGIGRGVYLPSAGAEIDAAFVERIDRHGIAQHIHIAVALRQALWSAAPTRFHRCGCDTRAACHREQNVPSRS